MTKGRFTHLSLLLGLFVLASGCNTSKDSAPPDGPSPDSIPPAAVAETGPHAAGIRVFNNHCLRCHSIGQGKKQGPDLVKVAANPEHSADWLGEYVRNPRAKKSDSRMPMFQGKLNDGEFKSLIDYLASLK